jgi:hypothetical protein
LQFLTQTVKAEFPIVKPFMDQLEVWWFGFIRALPSILAFHSLLTLQGNRSTIGSSTMRSFGSPLNRDNIIGRQLGYWLWNRGFENFGNGFDYGCWQTANYRFFFARLGTEDSIYQSLGSHFYFLTWFVTHAIG